MSRTGARENSEPCYGTLRSGLVRRGRGRQQGLADGTGQRQSSAQTTAPCAAPVRHSCSSGCPQFPANALIHRPSLLGYIMCEHIKVRPAAASSGSVQHGAALMNASSCVVLFSSGRASCLQSNAQLDGAFEYLKKVSCEGASRLLRLLGT
jgi:hypothetical protein